MMRGWKIGLAALGVAMCIGVVFVAQAPLLEERAEITVQGNQEAGEHLLFVAGCYACHTDLDKDPIQPFVGGPKLETPFGDFYAPNITSSATHGIGSWSIKTFEAAIRQGVNPQGHAYYPAFPYLSYRSLTDQDVSDLYAALMATKAVDVKGNRHDLKFPYNIRLGLKPWRWLFGSTQSSKIDQSTQKGRGQYLVNVVLHCGECHNPRNSMGAFIGPYLGGNDEIPGELWAPPITGSALAQMDWTEDDLFYFLGDGILPDGDSVGGSMLEVIDYGTRRLSTEDQAAIARFLYAIGTE